MRYMFLAFATAMTMVISCQSEDLLVPDVSVDNSEFVKVQFSTSVPAMEILKTKAVDPDGEAITKLVRFCFNERGLFVSTVEAETTPSTDLSGPSRCRCRSWHTSFSLLCSSFSFILLFGARNSFEPLALQNAFWYNACRF